MYPLVGLSPCLFIDWLLFVCLKLEKFECVGSSGDGKKGRIGTSEEVGRAGGRNGELK